MADCTLLPTCIFFNDRMAKMPDAAELLKAHYCRGSYQQCARYRVADALGRSAVPGDLYPHGTERAENLIAAAKV